LAQTPRPAAPYIAPAAPAAAVPATSSGSPVVKIVLIVVAVLIFLGLLSAGACVYMVYRAKQRMSQFEKQVQTTFPVPTPQAPTQPGATAQPSPQELATPIDPATLIYPGAIAKEGASVAMGGFQVQQYVTDDSVDKVLSFYKDKLGPKALVQETNNQALVQLGGPNGILSITIAHDQASGKTKLSITRIGK
jgi:hypothetical protein